MFLKNSLVWFTDRVNKDVYFYNHHKCLPVATTVLDDEDALALFQSQERGFRFADTYQELVKGEPAPPVQHAGISSFGEYVRPFLLTDNSHILVTNNYTKVDTSQNNDILPHE